MSQLEKRTETFASWLLISVGVVGLLLSALDFVGWEPSFLQQKGPLLAVWITVGLLSSAIGLERVVRFRRQDQQLERLDNLLAGALGGQHLERYNEVYDTLTRQVGTMQRRLRTITVSKPIAAPNSWAEAIARRLKETKRAGVPAEFKSIIAMDFDSLPLDFQQSIETRLNIYRKYGVRELVSLYLLDLKPPILFDLQIVDENHLTIALGTWAGQRNTPYAISFENQQKLATEFVDWYEQIALKHAIPYEIWMQKQPLQSSP